MGSDANTGVTASDLATEVATEPKKVFGPVMNGNGTFFVFGERVNGYRYFFLPRRSPMMLERDGLREDGSFF
jgi:hypothetical protein